MTYNIYIKNQKTFDKDISKLPNYILKNISGKIRELGYNGGESPQVKKLNHYKISDYRLRVGDYRVLFDVDETKKEIVIFRILHRSKLY